MKTSRFNVWVENYPDKGEYLLFNTRTQALIKVNQELKEALDDFKGYPTQLASDEILPNFKALRENGIIVENEKEEKDKLNDFFKQLQYESNKLTYEVTILTTYNCNFRCVYCFEKSVKEKVFLDKETSDLVVRWLKRRIEKSKLEKIHLAYYGGEPLLNQEPVYDISKRLHKWAEKKGIKLAFSIITNGSLVTQKLVKELLPFGLKTIRISLDGMREAHDKKRSFSDGRPSFDFIIERIKAVADKVEVGIAGNFDRENVDSIPKLLSYLESEGLLQKLGRVSFSPIAPRLGPKDNPQAVELTECLSFLDKGGLFEETINIEKELRRRGIETPAGLAINACPLIMQDGGITIDPRGIIYKCVSLLGYPEFSIGDVRVDGFNERFEKFLEIRAWNKCPEDCPYVPMCQGGCRFFSFLENKNFTDLSCKREYIDRVMPKLIRMEYDKAISNKSK